MAPLFAIARSSANQNYPFLAALAKQVLLLAYHLETVTDPASSTVGILSVVVHLGAVSPQSQDVLEEEGNSHPSQH